MKNIEELERKITAAMNQIKNGTAAPAATGIGSLFLRLKPLDEASHERLINKYKIIFQEWKSKNS